MMLFTLLFYSISICFLLASASSYKLIVATDSNSRVREITRHQMSVIAMSNSPDYPSSNNIMSNLASKAKETKEQLERQWNLSVKQFQKNPWTFWNP